MAELYPLCRSITGAGVRDTLAVIASLVPLELHEVASGTAVLDWTVPEEWNIREAWIADASGRRIVDFADSNLHVVSYSEPVAASMSLDELRPHLHSLPDQPDVIPYRTSYYQRSWGFCLPHRMLESLEPGDYTVLIDSTLAPGSLSYGEILVPGESADEILVSAHVCHPSLCDDNLSGIAVATLLARDRLAAPRRLSYRFVFAPVTIGAITWLDRNRQNLWRIRGGLTLTCLGDRSPLTYKRTEDGTTPIDRAMEHVLRHHGEHDVIDFFPYGYDERQYNSPGFRVPVGSLMRGRHGQFPEYHTSADNFDFVSAESLTDAFDVLRLAFDVLESDRTLVNREPHGEPQLGRRGLYRATGGTDIPGIELAMLWVLNQSDGTRSLLDIAERAGLAHAVVVAAADMLEASALVAPPL
jgi:aminopeptidase-like protein